MYYNKEDKINHINSMEKPVNRLLAALAKEGIEFCPTDGHLENVIFTKDDTVHKIAWECFYRFSGMSAYYKEYKGGKKGQIMVEVIQITDDFFMNDYMKHLILARF